jgi:hypothetical protein
MSPDPQPTRRLVAGIAAVALSFAMLAGCGGDGSSLNDDLRVALGDELADCLDDNLDDDMIDALNEDGIDFDVMSEATADAYAAALTVCQP